MTLHLTNHAVRRYAQRGRMTLPEAREELTRLLPAAVRLWEFDGMVDYELPGGCRLVVSPKGAVVTCWWKRARYGRRR